MKKVMSMVVACVLLVSMMVLSVVPVSAATPKEEIIAAVKASVSAELFEKYLPTLENTLAQVEVTAEQAEEVIANIETAKKSVKDETVKSLSEYTKEERAAVLKELDKACETLGVEYEVKAAAKPAHKGDVEVVVKVNDKVVAVVDGDDGVAQTNTPNNVNYTLVVLAGIFAAAAVVVAARCKKATSC